jgi:heme ABC exporter ATP-binding subunit CcmA
MRSDTLVSVTGLGKAFGSHRVLRDVSLVVHGGEALALLGPNGAGKTTLLRILATLLRPSRGTARVAGHDCAREPERVRPLVGLAGHGAGLYEDLTALENLTFWTGLGGLRPSRDALLAALADVELDRVAHARVRTFSAGMRRRLSLARLALGRPRVLLLDEPFAGLDQRARKWLEAHLEGFKAAGGALVMTTHSFGRELGSTDRVAVLAGGVIALDVPRAPLSADELARLYRLHAEEGA